MFGIGSFKPKLIRQSDANVIFEVTKWLVEHYGAPKPPKVHSPLEPAPKITDNVYQPSANINRDEWAQAVFEVIKSNCDMDDWPIQLVSTQQSNIKLRSLPFKSRWNEISQDPYKIDPYGRAVISYDQELCDTPGAFHTHIILKLAEIQMMNYQPGRKLSHIEAVISLLCAVSYRGKGLCLPIMFDMLGEYFSGSTRQSFVSKRIIDNTLIFSTCLSLRALNRMPEQIVASYGVSVDAHLRRKMSLSCRQIANFEHQLSELQNIVNPKRKRRVEKPELSLVA